MSTWNMPPGVTTNDIPGNRIDPERFNQPNLNVRFIQRGHPMMALYDVDLLDAGLMSASRDEIVDALRYWIGLAMTPNTELTRGEAVALNAGLGDWRLRRKLRIRMGIASFELPEGAIVAVTQLDYRYGKVLVEVGPAMCDWMTQDWLLANFENVT